MNIKATFDLSESERIEAFTYIMKNSYPGAQFFTLLGTSAIIAAAGLILDNATIVIGSMLVAPFLAPVMSLSIGVVTADSDLIRRAFIIVTKSILLVIFLSFITGLILFTPNINNSEILSRINYSLPYSFVAIAAGIAASVALANKNLRESMVGVAVSVALLPPLATTGIGLASLDGSIISGSFQLFLVNLIGIVLGGIAVFSLMGFSSTKKLIKKEIKKEEIKLEKEEKAELSLEN